MLKQPQTYTKNHIKLGNAKTRMVCPREEPYSSLSNTTFFSETESYNVIQSFLEYTNPDVDCRIMRLQECMVTLSLNKPFSELYIDMQQYPLNFKIFMLDKEFHF